MPRQTALSTVRAQLKAELGFNLSEGTGDDANLNLLLKSMQQFLADTADWSFLEKRFDVAAAAGSRYLTMPASPALNTQRPFKVEVFFNNFYYELDYGIGSPQYNYINSDLSRTLDPIQRWQDYDQTQFEIWPMNVTAQVVRFTGQRTLTAISGDSDTFDLDDLLVVLFTAAEYALRQKWPDATSRQQRAQERYRALRTAYPSTTMRVVFGEGYDETQSKIYRRPMVLIAP